MSEYIYASTGEPLAHIDGEITLARKEIVRCRDCKHYKYGFACEENGCAYCGEPLRTEPDGFCAWGEREENGR